MRVDLKDGECRQCGGPLDVIDADDISLTVACSGCGDTYQVETDALNDGGVFYWPHVITELLKGEDRV